jgi:hypothetical protein
VTAADLLSELRRRGVELVPDGGDLCWRAPRGAVTAADLEALRAHKAALLAELRGQRHRPDGVDVVGGHHRDDGGALGDADRGDDGGGLLDADDGLGTTSIPETREQPGAVLIRSARFGREVWIALDPCMVPELQAEEAERPEPRPVLTPEDVARLRGKPEGAIRAVLNALAVFPGSRLMQ